MVEFGVKPTIRLCTVHMRGIEQRNEYVHIEQGAHHTPSASRSRSTSALVTGTPREAKGRKPVIARFAEAG